MHIGVFTALDNKSRLEKLLSSYDDVTFEFFPYGNVEEVVDSFNGNSRFLDGYLFSGFFSYRLIEQKMGEFDKPVTYLKISEADFYKRLALILIENPSIDLSRVFLDFHAESENISDFLMELAEENRPLLADEKHVYISEDVYDRALTLHKKLHEEGRADVSFTRFANIVQALDDFEIPNYYFDISDEAIKGFVDDLINEVNVHLLRDNQIVCGAIKVKVEDEDAREIQMLNLHSALLDFNYQEHHELMVHEREDYFEIMTNYLEIESLTNNFVSCSLLHFLQKKLKDSIHIGWGIGKTFTQARVNAQMASDYSYNNEVSSTYVLQDEENMIGPLIGKLRSGHRKSIINPVEITKLMEKIDMTRDKINKIFLAFNKVENEHISSSLFAKTVGLSVRSANRILKEAEEKKLVLAMIDSAAGLQGRPRKLYRLNREVIPT